jgi:secreted trypsin-like serine protease
MTVAKIFFLQKKTICDRLPGHGEAVIRSVGYILSLILLAGCAGQRQDNSFTVKAAENVGIIGADANVNFNADQNTVQIRKYTADGTSLCSAVLIRQDVLLTAAHCVGEKNEVLLGNGKVMPITDVRMHPGYVLRKEETYVYDIAVVKLEKPLSSSEYQAVALPLADLKLSAQTSVVAAGFGYTDIHNDVGNGNSVVSFGGDGVLRTTTLQTLDFDIKQPRFTVDMTQGQGVCFGDSGGPAMVAAAGNGSSTVVGIASTITSESCDDQGVYINVKFYLDWIQKELQSLN